MIEKWTSHSGYVPLLSKPDARAPKINGININPGVVVDSTGAKSGEFEEVIYDGLTGWVKASYIEPYHRKLRHGLVDFGGLQTPTKKDFAQYVNLFGTVQYNLCGPIAIAMRLDISLPKIIEQWQYADLSFFQRIWRWNTSKRATGTSDGDLVRIFKLFNVEAETLSKYPRWTPQLVQDLLGAIVSVRIGANGRCNGGGILHWCVLAETFITGCGGGYVILYNPANDTEELYSYNEFVATSRVPYGAISQSPVIYR